MKNGTRRSFFQTGTRRAVSLLVLVPNGTLHAQTGDSLTYELSPIVVTAPRVETPERTTPFAITVIGKGDVQTATPQLSPAEFLNMAPGVFTMNPDNFAQDVRVSIRGFGARSSFGIRGVKLVVDGFPVSTPDGQAEVDDIDPGNMRRVEIIRGPAATLYGNATGGVINIRTEEIDTPLLLKTRASGGMYGYGQLQATIGQAMSSFDYSVRAARSQLTGYRAHSGMRSTLFNAHARITIDSASSTTILLSYVDSPMANDPGALTADQVVHDRRQAQSANLAYNAGEDVSQGRFGVQYRNAFLPGNVIQLTAFGAIRGFNNRLPFQQGGMVRLDRTHAGGSLEYQYSGTVANSPYSLIAGVDLENQNDGRRQMNNNQGQAGDLVLDQREEFLSAGLFVEQQWEVRPGFRCSAGLRYDALRVRLTDFFLNSGNGPGKRILRAWSPQAGIVLDLSAALTCYGNVATGFESPALIELSNNPAGTGGLNPNLEPERSTNYELGVKGLAPSGVRYDLAVFAIDVRNALTPFELPGFPGRTYYRNAGRSRRLGLECGCSAYLGAGFSSVVSYTFSDFVYRRFQSATASFDGNVIPGIPRHSFFTEVAYSPPDGAFAKVQVRGYSSMFADDANSVEEKGTVLVNIRLGNVFHVGAWTIEPFVAVNNLFNSRYDANVRINATGGKYFEPASGTGVFGGMTVSMETAR